MRKDTLTRVTSSSTAMKDARNEGPTTALLERTDQTWKKKAHIAKEARTLGMNFCRTGRVFEQTLKKIAQLAKVARSLGMELRKGKQKSFRLTIGQV